MCRSFPPTDVDSPEVTAHGVCLLVSPAAPVSGHLRNNEGLRPRLHSVAASRLAAHAPGRCSSVGFAFDHTLLALVCLSRRSAALGRVGSPPARTPPLLSPFPPPFSIVRKSSHAHDVRRERWMPCSAALFRRRVWSADPLPAPPTPRRAGHGTKLLRTCRPSSRRSMVSVVDAPAATVEA